MLKRFSVENFSSFRQEQSLDLTASRTEVLPDHVTEFKNVKLLKSAIIYGANASGKSNLIKAIDFAKDVILEGINNVDTYKKYFRLDNESSKKPSSFEFEVELNNKFYSYGFNALLKDKVIVDEWLYEIGNAKPILIFQRDGKNIELGKTLLSQDIKARFEIYIEDMKNQKSQLFLSEIAEKELDFENVNVINDLYQWFNDKLVILYPKTRFSGVGRMSSDNEVMFTKYLCKFDTGVVNLESIEEDFETNFKSMPDEIKNDIENSLAKDEVKEIVLNDVMSNQFLTIYKTKDGELRVKKIGLVHGKTVKEVFELKDESDGTKRLLDFIPLINKFTEDYTVLIDEFDRSLHPKLTKAFFELFYELNKKNSQLIVTTHESTLLDLDLVRRDEIWFVEKDDEGSSSLFSLNKFKVRYDSKIEKAYLLGRYGAVPLFNHCLWDDDNGI